MTINEAKERAEKIWGSGVEKVQIRPDGGADIDYGYADAMPYGYHRLDANGHAVCHVDCRAREHRGTVL